MNVSQAQGDTRHFLELLFEPGDVFEVRAPGCRERSNGRFASTASGYFTFDAIPAAAEQIAELDGSGLAPGIYVTLNPVAPDLLARSANRIKPRARETTQDKDIVCRRWLLIDVDANRPAGVSTTEAELAAALTRAEQVAAFLADQDWPAPVFALSGNGYHLLYRIGLPADDGGLVQRVLTTLAERFSDEAIAIDRSVHNPARITKVIGTVARKGDDLQNTPGVTDRPHRRSALIHVPEILTTVTTEQLAALAPAPSTPSATLPALDEPLVCTPAGVRAWLASRGVQVKSERRNGNKTLLLLDYCPINPEIVSTGGSDIAVLVGDDGKLAYCNKHNRGQSFTWHDLRRTLEPGWEPPPQETNDVDLSGLLPSARKTEPEVRRADRPPDPGPLPAHLLDVPGFIGEVMQYNLATATRPQPVLAMAAAITLQAVLAARKVRDQRGNRTNLFCVGIAPSGAGKDHARKVNKNILFQAGLNLLEGNEDLASDAGLVAAIEQEPALLFQLDEFGRFLRTIGDPKKAPHLFNVLGALMKLYSSADTVFRGKAYADHKRNKVIDQPCAIIYGTTVPEHFYESLTADSLSDGFIARLLVFEASETPARQYAMHREIPAGIIEAARWWGNLQPGGNLRDEHPEPLVVPHTDEAREVFDRLAATVDAQLSKPDVEGRSLWARAEEKACRLAVVHACSANREKPVIDDVAARWACDLVGHLTRRMLHLAHEWVADGMFDARQKRVLRVIRKAGRISRTQLCFRTRWLNQRERQEVIDNLVETDQIRVITSKTGERGRPTVEYEVC